jgi:hypothetical protein
MKFFALAKYVAPTKCLALTTLLFASALTFAASAEPTNFSKAHWEETSDRDGIKLSRWNVPNSPVPAFRGDGIIDSPGVRVSSVLLQTDRRHEWVPFVEEAKVLRRNSKTDWVEYWHLSLPVVSDRDLVVRIKLDFNPDTKTVKALYYSVDDELAPKTDHVRARALGGYYILSPIDGGKRTQFTYEGHVDLGGSVPKWMTLNTSQEYPEKMLKGVRKQVKKEDIAVNQKLQLLIDGKLKALEEAL